MQFRNRCPRCNYVTVTPVLLGTWTNAKIAPDLIYLEEASEFCDVGTSCHAKRFEEMLYRKFG